MAINFGLGEDLEMIVDTVASFAADQLGPNMREAEKAKDAPAAISKAYAELGLAGLDLPEEAGGAGLDIRAAVVVAEELARGDMGLAAALPGPGIAGQAVQAFGTPEQVAAFYQPFLDPSGEPAWAALLFGETLDETDPEAVALTAAKDGDGYKISGKCGFVLNADKAGTFVLLARTGEGNDTVKAFVADKSDAISVGEPEALLGMDACHFCPVEVTGLKVGADAELTGAESAAEAVKATATRLRLWACALVTGALRSAGDEAVTYANEREAFGQKIKEFQGVSFMLADMATDADAARWMLRQAADAVARGDKDWYETAAMATGQIADKAMRVCTDAVQVLGGAGFTQDFAVEKYMRDTLCLTSIVGSSIISDAALAAASLG